MRKQAVALFCADLHLSDKPPIARAQEEDWNYCQKEVLLEINVLADKHNCDVYVAGDIFDKPRVSPALEILAINEVQRLEDEGFRADVVWTVSGSVSHFGHTHYRRNQNHALVTFVVDDDTWKMREIEVIEEQRLL